MSDVAVVGAGIVGASVAYHLARRGVSVTLIDGAPAPAAGVTGGSFAWIGESGGDWPGGAQDLRGSVIADHRRLAAEVPGVSVRWTGSLSWPSGADDAVGDGRHLIGRDEIAGLEPNLRTPPPRAVFTPTDGGVDPVRTTQALVRAARAHGARVVLDAPVTSLKVTGGHTTGVLTATDFHPASTVVLAAGTNIPTLCEPLGVAVPVAPSPAFLVRASAPPELIRTIIATPEFEAREAAPGELRMTAPFGAESLAEHARRALAALTAAFGTEVRLLAHRLSHRPMPPTGPLVGPVTPDRSVYVTVMHSAITLAPTVGRLAAEELVTDRPAPELSRCRPDRRRG